MAETNNDSVPEQETKKKKAPVKRTREDKPAKEAVKKLPVKKDAAPPAAKGETVEKLRKFMRGAWAELKKVTWPNRRQLIAYTGVVFVSVVFIGVLIWIADSLLSRILGAIIK